MSVTLSKQNSKFMLALENALDKTVIELLEFEKAVISDSGSQWQIYFNSVCQLDDAKYSALKQAVKKIVPPLVEVELFVRVEAPTQALEEPDFDDVPLPEEAPEENEELPQEEIPTVLEQDTLTPEERYKRRMEQLTREAAKNAKPSAKPASKKRGIKSVSADGIALYGKDFSPKKITPINEIDDFTRFVTIEGDVIGSDIITYKSGKGIIFTFNVTDYTSSITCKLFALSEQADELLEKISGHIIVQGTCSFDTFASELTINPKAIKKAPAPKEQTDNAPVKRVELHLHTKMSQMDGVLDVSKLLKLMKKYGHDTVALTDHGVVQAFPDMEAAIAKQKMNDVKIIFGTEGYLLNDDPVLELGENKKLRELKYCVYSISTTGESVLTDSIIEIGACIFDNGALQEQTFYSLVNPHRDIDESQYENISNAALSAAPDIDAVIKAFWQFAQGCVLVSHESTKTMPFILKAGDDAKVKTESASVDTLRVSRELISTIKSGKFNKVCDALDIKTGEIENALKKAELTAVIWRKLLEHLESFNVFTVDEFNKKLDSDAGSRYHIIIIAKNKVGLKNLYTLVTESHLHHLRRKRPQIPRSLLKKHREGLIIASACEAGELFRAIVSGANDEKLKQIASFYDYLEVQPLGNNEFMLREGLVSSREQLIDLNKKVIWLGEELNIPVIATGDVHYLLKRDAIYRSIIQCAEGYSDADKQAPLYYRTTEEMLDEFYYLDEKKRYEIVVENTRALAAQCEKMESFPRDRLYTPTMENAEEDLRQMCFEKAYKMYGNPLPEIVQKRLDKEINSIINNGYAVLYLIAHKVVKKSNSDGYMVGSRGSVGSSFAATMADITEVNPLTPHYLCPECQYSDFDIDLSQYDCGIDLPHKKCPKCSHELLRLGFNIPFEVFMGFNGDKVPDIDLNFSGVYQPEVHKYIEELFGEKYVFRAGTIGGVADKTAIGYTKKYCEEYSLARPRKAELERLASGCIDVKRTTGQHAGGVVIVPKEYDINEFTPLQYPANDPEAGVITTHFTFNSLHDTLLKADILGHDDPTVIRMLEDLTGVNAKEVPLDDPGVMSLFLSTKALGISEEELGTKTGTFGIPEFGTAFTRKMLEKTKPKTFSDLVKISGLSHGTDVWTNNAERLIDENIVPISKCICTREDIMNNLIQYGVEQFAAFDTMEKVRKGKGIPEKYLEEIRAHGIPEWFIESCNLIKYMFPKAHAAAYVTTALRIAWFKVYKPHQYYATYFSVRADDFEVSLAQKDKEEIKQLIAQYRAIPKPNPREKGIIVMLEIVLEMKLRGIEFTNIDIYLSDATKFTITEDNLIRPPLNAVPQLGETAAQSIVDARKIEPFKSQDDLLLRTKLSNTLIKSLEDCGCLKNLPKSQQISIFDL